MILTFNPMTMNEGRPLSIPVILGITRKGRMSAHAARGTLMNRHAEKTVKDAHALEGEVIASIHYCPGCGKVEAEIESPDQ